MKLGLLLLAALAGLLLRQAEAFAAREDKTFVPAVLKKLSAEYSKTANRTQDKNEP